MLKVFGGVLGAIAVVVLLIGLSFGFLYLNGFFTQTKININRENTQHSQEYVETKRSLLLSLIIDADKVEGGQKIAVINRFCEEYSYVDFDVPTTIHAFADRNCN